MELNKVEEERKFLEDSESSTVSSREQWGNKLQSILTLLGYIVSVGNLWRFPYMCLKNGGGAFLIPCILSGIFLVYPIFLLEVSVGQFTSKAIHKCWEACPLLKGIGFGMLSAMCLCGYYVMIVTWTMYFIGSSFTSPLQWTSCDNWWNTDSCHANGEDFGSDVMTMTENSCQSRHIRMIDFSKTNEAPSAVLRHKVLQLSSGIDNLGGFNVPLLLCLAGSWFIIFLCIMKGVETIGKVVYVTATLPILLIVILLIRSLLEPGAVNGVMFLVKPDLKKLKDVNVWIEAAIQMLYSSSVLWGPLITIQGFNKFKNNCVRDAILVLCLGEGTSLLSGFLVFSVLGSMAHAYGLPLQDIAKSGPGLAFIVYPEAVSRLPIPNLWAVLFFLMIYTLALDSTFGTFEPIITAVTDSFTLARKHRIKATFLILFIMFLCSIPFTTKAGFFLFQLVDWYIVSICFPLFGIIECLIFGWIYGADRFSRDIELMTDKHLPVFLRFCWCIITPIGMFILLVSVVLLYEPPSYGDYQYPTAATACGFVIALIPVIPIPVIAINEIRKAEGYTFMEKLRNASKPSRHWRPSSDKLKLNYRVDNKFYHDKSVFDIIKINLLGKR